MTEYKVIKYYEGYAVHEYHRGLFVSDLGLFDEVADAEAYIAELEHRFCENRNYVVSKVDHADHTLQTAYNTAIQHEKDVDLEQVAIALTALSDAACYVHDHLSDGGIVDSHLEILDDAVGDLEVYLDNMAEPNNMELPNSKLKVLVNDVALLNANIRRDYELEGYDDKCK